MSEFSDAELIERIQAGGRAMEDAITGIYKKYFAFVPSIHKQFPSITMDEVKGLYSDAILSFIHKVQTNSFNTKGKIASFLYTILKNNALNASRKNKPNVVGFDAHSYSDDKYAEYNTPLNKVIEQEQRERIQTALELLPNKCRETLLLWSMGYSMKEIVEMLELKNANAARVRKYQCLSKLKEILVDIEQNSRS